MVLELNLSFKEVFKRLIRLDTRSSYVIMRGLYDWCDCEQFISIQGMHYTRWDCYAVMKLKTAEDFATY